MYYQYEKIGEALYIVRYNPKTFVVEDWNNTRKTWRASAELLKYVNGMDNDLFPCTEEEAEKMIAESTKDNVMSYQYEKNGDTLYIVRLDRRTAKVEDWNNTRKTWQEDRELMRYFAGVDNDLFPCTEEEAEKMIAESTQKEEGR